MTEPLTRSERKTNHSWDGPLLIKHGVAAYLGRAGDSRIHSHQSIQISVFDSRGQIVRTDQGETLEGGAFVIGSQVRHRVLPNSADGLFIFIDPTTFLGRRVVADLLGDKPVWVGRDRSDFDTAQMIECFDLAKSSGLERGISSIQTEFGATAELAKPTDERVYRALIYIDKNICEKIRLGDVASHAGMSTSRFSVVFKHETGMALRAYVLWQRLQVALEMAIQGVSLTVAAHEAGFSDSAHLSRTMRSMFGIAPSALSATVS